jgi:hypothetical protein
MRFGASDDALKEIPDSRLSIEAVSAAASLADTPTGNGERETLFTKQIESSNVKRFAQYPTNPSPTNPIP